MFGPAPPDWQQEGRDWPNRSHSRFIQAGHLRWHVQMMGPEASEGSDAPGAPPPVLLLAHGTGAATHSWRGLMPMLARHFTVVAPDLPGHGFTGTPPSPRMTLPGMARNLTALLEAMEVRPDIVVGHSAGAAILARMCLDGGIHPRALVALNGAFLPFREGQGQLFMGLAKLLVMNPLVPRLFSWSAGDRRSVEKLIRDTGSTIDRRGVDLYARLLKRPGHVAGALAMMANWDLAPLLRDMPGLIPRLVLVAAGNDTAIKPEQAARIAAMVPGAVVEPLPGLGHLAHEERPELLADLILRAARGTGLP